MDVNCPKCDADISETYEATDWSTGINGGWYCDTCDLGVAESDASCGSDDDVQIAPSDPAKPIGTPLSALSGRPGHAGYESFKRIAASWGYD